MKTIDEVRQQSTAAHPTLKSVCLASCQKLLAQLEKTKEAILNEFGETLKAHEQLLYLALNEAEALARQTDYPHLVFPTLAAEKAQAVVAWHTRQQSIQRTNSGLAFAA